MPTKPMPQVPSSNNKKWLLVILTIIFFLLIGYIFHKDLYKGNSEKSDSNQTETSTPQTNTPDNKAEPTKPKPQAEQPKPSSTPTSSTVKLKVPFTAQAPTANWDELHNEACEEASAIMAYAYFNNITSLPPAVVEEEIQKLTEWQKENYGYYLSINTQEAARMIREVYGLSTEIVEMSEPTIKQALADDKLIVFPAQGQKLGNPNFTAPGPIYHMLVITGYNETNFITNDPGTRKGFNYTYSYKTLYGAAGNWSHDDHAVNQGDKKIIIVSK